MVRNPFQGTIRKWRSWCIRRFLRHCGGASAHVGSTCSIVKMSRLREPWRMAVVKDQWGSFFRSFNSKPLWQRRGELPHSHPDGHTAGPSAGFHPFRRKWKSVRNHGLMTTALMQCFLPRGPVCVKDFGLPYLLVEQEGGNRRLYTADNHP